MGFNLYLERCRFRKGKQQLAFAQTQELDFHKRGQFNLIQMPGRELFMSKSFHVYHKNRPLSPLAQESLELLRSQEVTFLYDPTKERFQTTITSSIFNYEN